MNKFKKGDKVIVLAGKDKGKIGEIIRVFSEDHYLYVEGVNMIKKHVKPTRESQGGIMDRNAKIHWSNVSLLCPKTEKPTRVTFEVVKGKKYRKAVVSKELF